MEGQEGGEAQGVADQKKEPSTWPLVDEERIVGSGPDDLDQLGRPQHEERVGRVRHGRHRVGAGNAASAAIQLGTKVMHDSSAFFLKTF
jgi:hypothetical protein